jgi:hypothetical protein
MSTGPVDMIRSLEQAREPMGFHARPGCRRAVRHANRFISHIDLARSPS